MRSLLVVALIALLLAPAAQAQNQADPVPTVEASATEVVVNRDDTSSFTLTISYTSQNPFDSPEANNPRTVILNTPTLPDGWVAQYSPGTSFQLSAGEEQTVTVTVGLAASVEESTQVMSFTATVQGRAGLAVPGNEPVTSDPIQVTLQREDPLTREVLEGIGPWIFLVLGGLAALAVVLAVVLARNNRAVVALKSNVNVANVAPGRSVAVPVSVENLTSNEDTILFHVARVRDGWAASLPVPELHLEGRRREELHLVITAPKDARPGDNTRVGITAHGAQNPRKVAELVVDMQVGDTSEKIAAGDTTFADQQH